MKKALVACLIFVTVTAIIPWTIEHNAHAQIIPNWTCKLPSPQFQAGPNWFVNITCADGTGNVSTGQFQVPTNASATWIGDTTQQFIASLIAQYSNLKTLPAPGITITPSVVTPPPPPDPPDQSLVAFQTLVKQARSLIGIVPVDSKVLAALISQIETTLEAHPEYLDSI